MATGSRESETSGVEGDDERDMAAVADDEDMIVER